MWYMHDIGWGWGLVMTLGMVAVWALVIYGLVWLIGGGARSSEQRPPARPEPPVDILKRRLAAGEISVEEYDDLPRALDEPLSEPATPAVR